MVRSAAPAGADETAQRYRLVDGAAPPAFPPVWRTPFILSPFGDAARPELQPARARRLTYAADWQGGAGMLVDLYLVESLTCISFFVRNNPDGTAQWWWLCKDSPSGPVRHS